MEQKRYYYRLPLSTTLGKEFRSLHRECDRADKAADKFCAKVGAKMYYPLPRAMAGGVLCVSFDEKPDQQLWRHVATDEDGVEMYEPRCDKREGSIVYNPKRKPSNTATRLYSRQPAIDGRLHYIELHYDSEAKCSDKRRKTPCYVRKAIRLERERMLLPQVLTDRFFKLLDADLLADMRQENHKQYMVAPVTPVFFDFDGYYYLCIAYPCRAEGLQEMTQEAFMQRKEDMLRYQRDIEAMNNLKPNA